jgi:hypothetical protein
LGCCHVGIKAIVFYSYDTILPTVKHQEGKRGIAPLFLIYVYIYKYGEWICIDACIRKLGPRWI